MNHNLRVAFGGLFALMLAACSSGGGSSPAASDASPSSSSSDPSLAGDLSTIQQAINAASPGDTIVIPAGTYDGRVVVKKSITLLGAGPTTLLRGIAGREDAVVEIVDAADVVVMDLAVTGPHQGVRVRRSARVRIEGVRAEDNGDEGIEVRQSDEVLVATCTCIGNLSGGIRVRESSMDVVIDDCTVTGNFDQGVEVRDSVGVDVRASTIAGNAEDGVRLRDSASIVIQDNVIEDNVEYGVRAVSTPVDPAGVGSGNQLRGNGQGDVRVE